MASIFSCYLDVVKAEISLPGLVFFEHQQTTHLPKSVRRGKLSDSNRFSNTPNRRFYLFSDHFWNIAVVDSHFLKNIKKTHCHFFTFT